MMSTINNMKIPMASRWGFDPGSARAGGRVWVVEDILGDTLKLHHVEQVFLSLLKSIAIRTNLRTKLSWLKQSFSFLRVPFFHAADVCSFLHIPCFAKKQRIFR